MAAQRVNMIRLTSVFMEALRGGGDEMGEQIGVRQRVTILARFCRLLKQTQQTFL